MNGVFAKGEGFMKRMSVAAVIIVASCQSSPVPTNPLSGHAATVEQSRELVPSPPWDAGDETVQASVSPSGFVEVSVRMNAVGKPSSSIITETVSPSLISGGSFCGFTVTLTMIAFVPPDGSVTEISKVSLPLQS